MKVKANSRTAHHRTVRSAGLQACHVRAHRRGRPKGPRYVRHLAAALVVLCVLPAHAQESAAPTPPPDYTYAVEGRRDPFVRTVGRTSAPTLNLAVRPQGVAGLLAAEVIVRGFLESRGTWLAMIAAPNGRNYTLREGDRLMDGVVSAITSDTVVILQDVSDPMSPVKQREVRKTLRGGEQVP